MSENLNDSVEVVVQDSEVITVPIDTTLSNSGEAADAKAVGDALALKADKSELQNTITVNGQAADNQGHIIVTAADTEMSSTDDTTVKDAIDAAASRTGADIPVSSAVGAKTIGEAITDIDEKTAADIPMTTGGQTIAQKITTMETVDGQNSEAISALQQKAGDTILFETGESKTVKQAIEERVKLVNNVSPDSNGNVNVEKAMFADNLTTNMNQTTTGEFVRRTAGGDASIQDGSAWLTNVMGNRSKAGYIPESLTMTVTPVPREEGQEPISATIDRDTFVAYVDSSTTVNLFYTTDWNSDPTLYGVTVTGTPLAGDQITILYVKENRGTITQSNPQKLIATGWNLYNDTNGYAAVMKYSNVYGFAIKGNYSAVKYSSTLTGDKTVITPDENGLFTIPANGYVWVTDGDATTTEIYMTWADWITEGPEDFEAYTESEIDLSAIMSNYFPNGLLRVGDIRDEIDLNTGSAISRVERMEYSAENLATAKASGRTWEADENYIYLERLTPITNTFILANEYVVSDHGLETITGTSLAVYAVIIYGNNLKNKLERDVVTLSPQTLSAQQKGSARSNIGAASADDLSSANQAIANLQGGIAYIVGNTNTSGVTLAVGQFVYVKGHSTISEGLRKVTASISANANITTSNTSACPEGGLNALNSKLTTTAVQLITTPQSYYTLQNFHAHKTGNMLTIFMDLKLDVRAGSWAGIGTLQGVTLADYYEFSVAPYNSNNQAISVHLWTSGAIGVAFGGSAGDNYRVTVTVPLV